MNDPGPMSGMAFLVSQARPHSPRAFDPGMVQGHRLHFPRNLRDRDRLRALAQGGNHDAEDPFVNEIGARSAQPGCKQSIGR